MVVETIGATAAAATKFRPAVTGNGSLVGLVKLSAKKVELLLLDRSAVRL